MTTTSEQRSYRIGELAQHAGVTTRTIRYYEELGLLGCHAGRLKGGHRHYTENDLHRLRELIRLRDLLGLSLDQLHELAETEQARANLRQQWHHHPTDQERLHILDQSITLLERQLALVHTRQQTLAEFAHELDDKLRTLKKHHRQLGNATPSSRRKE